MLYIYRTDITDMIPLLADGIRILPFRYVR